MSTKTTCNNPLCGEYGSIRTVTDVDKINGWDNCLTCDGNLITIEEDYYQEEETLKYACSNIGCIDHGNPIHLNLWELERCEDICDTCGKTMEPFDTVFDDGLANMEGLFLPQNISREDCMDRSSSSSSIIGSCVDYYNSLNRGFKYVKDKVIKKKSKCPVMFISEGLVD